MNSDEIVESLKPYGLTRVHQHDDGFGATLCLFINGLKAEVHSGFKHPTMLSALTALQAKVGSILNQRGHLQVGVMP